MARRKVRRTFTTVLGPPGGLFFLVWLLIPAGPAAAQWPLEGESNLFYTDDVALFSASRRLALREDPTQPVVDRTGQGSDMVVEPMAQLQRAFSSRAGNTELAFRAQGFVFAQHPIFNHGTPRSASRRSSRPTAWCTCSTSTPRTSFWATTANIARGTG